MSGSVAHIEPMRVLHVRPVGHGWLSRVIVHKHDLATLGEPTLPNVSHKVNWHGLSRDISNIREILRAAPTVNRVQVVYRSGVSFFRVIVPTILIAKYYGKPVELLFESNKAEVDLESYGRGMLPFLSYCDRLIVSSRYTNKVLKNFGLDSELVFYQIDRTLFKPKMRSQLQPRIVTARRLLRGNNLSVAIKAFQLVKRKYPRAELIVLGDGPQFDGLNWLVDNESMQGVTFCGQVTQSVCATEFQKADVYLNPSSIDGLPRSILEALACGLPVISTSVGDVPSIIRHEENGLLIEKNSFVALANAIIRLVEERALVEKLSINAIAGSALNVGVESATTQSRS